MNRERDQDPGEISIGSDHATIRRPHQRSTIVARILYRTNDVTGNPTWVVLDRLVHRPGEASLGGWSVSGAVTTELRP